jgi:hypothetical protein
LRENRNNLNKYKMTLEEFSNKLYESKILHDYKDGKVDYRKVHDWIVSQEKAINVIQCCKSDSEQLPCGDCKPMEYDVNGIRYFKCRTCRNQMK